MLRSYLITLFGILVLLLGVAAVVAQLGPPQPPRFTGRVEDLLPSVDEVPGWSVKLSPVADTPEMKKAVQDALNFDDAIFAVYTRKDIHIAVYLAYWRPDKMPYRLVAGHTPDVCWVLSGWQLSVWERKRDLVCDDLRLMSPAEHRIFTLNGNTEHVLFWHFVDGNIQSYGTQGNPPWYAILGDMFRKGFNQRGEQLFIRVSSNYPLEVFQLEPVLPILFRHCSPYLR